MTTRRSLPNSWDEVGVCPQCGSPIYVHFPKWNADLDVEDPPEKLGPVIWRGCPPKCPFTEAPTP